jgi:hypothetical protein
MIVAVMCFQAIKLLPNKYLLKDTFKGIIFKTSAIVAFFLLTIL